MTEYRATPEQWADVEDWAAVNGVSHACLLELRSRVEQLEAASHKHIVETSANILALASRVESLETMQQRPDLCAPKQIRVKDWYEQFDCARSSAYKWLADLGIRPWRKVNKVTGKVESWLTDEQVTRLNAYAKARYGYSEPSKTHEISKPLKLTPEQAQQVRDLLAPNSKPTPNSSQIGGSLVERVEDALMESVKGQGSMARAAIREVALWLNEAPLDLYPGDRGIVVNALYDQANQ